jgi:uracil phosphoribosyltransferase
VEELEDFKKRYPNLIIVDPKLVKLGMSKIRDKNTNLNDFRKYSDRVIRLIIEYGISGFAEKS